MSARFVRILESPGFRRGEYVKVNVNTDSKESSNSFNEIIKNAIKDAVIVLNNKNK